MKKFLGAFFLMLGLMSFVSLAHAQDIFTYNLAYGMQGDTEVGALQSLLISHGYLAISAPTNNFGSMTLTAVKKFQSANGINPTGYVGALTRASLNNLMSGTANSVTFLPQGCASATQAYSTVTGKPCASITATPVLHVAPVQISNITATSASLASSYSLFGNSYNTVWFEYALSPDGFTTNSQVKSGQIIESKTPVSKTQVLARNDAKVSLGAAEKAEMRRLLLISPESKEIINLKTAPVVKEGDLVSLDQIISESGEKSQIAGQILEVNKNELVIHTSRPYLISQGAQLQVDNESLVQRGDFLATLVFERQKTGDIVQGLPRVEELLEGRKPKESAILAEENGEAVLEYEEDAVRLFLAGETGRQEIKVPIDSSIIVTDKQKIKQGQPLTSGPLNPHDVVRLSGVEAVQQYLLDEVQRVYRSQGVEIADKHVEVIVRQMSKKVKVDESGDTKLLPGELTEMHTVEVENKAVAELGGEQATWHPVLLGITKASLNTESFISAASFQETTRVLTEAAVEGKKDMLRGLKENVIIGRLIPAGTGYYHLTHSSEDLEEEERKRRNRNSARKPSAILEEIEGLFGAPDFSIEEAMGAVIQEDVEDLEDLSEETETVEETEE